jgi:hypothetical protein
LSDVTLPATKWLPDGGLEGDVHLTGTYLNAGVSGGQFVFSEAGHEYSAETYLVYNEERILLNEMGIGNFKEQLFEVEENEIFLSGAQLFELRVPSTGTRIDISSNSFPGTYYVTGDTYARNEITGKDEFFQLVFPRTKLLAESNTITMEADGDPTVFNMSLKVLRTKNGSMMSLIQYDTDTVVEE